MLTPILILMDANLKAGLLIAVCLAGVIVVMVLLARWARSGSKGAVLGGALMSMFAPDPEFEKNIRLAEEARVEQHEEDEEGQDRDPPASGSTGPPGVNRP